MSEPVPKIDPGDLSDDVSSFVAWAERQHHINWWQSYLTGILSLVFSAAVVLAGLYDAGKVAAIFGILTGLLLSFEKFDPSSEKAQFYRELINEGKRLAMDLRDEARPFQEIRAELIILRTHSVRELPRQGLAEAIKQLNEQLGGAKWPSALPPNAGPEADT